MDRIVINGNSGSGKSSLARALAGRGGLAHLDLIAWEPGRPGVRADAAESECALLRFVEAADEYRSNAEAARRAGGVEAT